jgi:hypothetical protein
MNDGLPLRDIHLPEPVSWWPPAPGWWLLLALLFAAGLGAWLRQRHHARHELRRQALEELERIENRFGRGDDELRILEELSALLRRTAIARYPREQVASLTGQRWLRFLDGVMGGDGFSRGPGRALADAPYRPSIAADNIPDLIDLCRRWLDAEFRRKDV